MKPSRMDQLAAVAVAAMILVLLLLILAAGEPGGAGVVAVPR